MRASTPMPDSAVARSSLSLTSLGSVAVVVVGGAVSVPVAMVRVFERVRELKEWLLLKSLVC
jgi:hypothetical protein